MIRRTGQDDCGRRWDCAKVSDHRGRRIHRIPSLRGAARTGPCEVFILEPGGTTKIRHLHRAPEIPRRARQRDGHGHPRFVRSRKSISSITWLPWSGVEHYVGDPYQVLNVNVNGTQNVSQDGLQVWPQGSYSARRPKCTVAIRTFHGRKTTTACSVRRALIGGVTPHRRPWGSTSASPTSKMGLARHHHCATSTSSGRDSTSSTPGGSSRSSWGSFFETSR